MNTIVDIINFIEPYLSNPTILLNLLVIVFASISLYHLNKAEKHMISYYEAIDAYYDAIDKNKDVFAKALRELIEKSSSKKSLVNLAGIL